MAGRRHALFEQEGTPVEETSHNCFPVEALSGAHHLQVQFKEVFPFPKQDYGHDPEFFRHRIQELPESLRQLLTHVERLATKETIKACLDRHRPIYLASDGGAIPGHASFGWIIQIGTTKIAKAKGPVHGVDPRSFRAEGYGMASALLYLRLLKDHFEFTRTRTSVNKLICDNKGLLTRIEAASEWLYYTPNITLRAEWDIESVILAEHRKLGMQFIFQHVKSHQDDEADLESLSLDSRLNVEADKLATAAKHRFGWLSTTTTTMPYR
jgi:hypothetical protein